MNKIYKVIWSKAKNCYVVASELAKRSGKSAQKAVVGAIITGILSVGMAGDVLAASLGYSYNAGALLSSFTTDEGTGLGFSLIRGDRQSNVKQLHVGVEYVRRDASGAQSYQAGFYNSSGNFTYFRDEQGQNIGGSFETAYEYIKNLPGTTYTYNGSQITFASGIYFDKDAMISYLKEVKGISDETIGQMTITDETDGDSQARYRFTTVEAESEAKFMKTLVEKTETAVKSTVGQVLKPGENVAIQKVGRLTQKDKDGNIEGYVDKDGNLIKDASDKVITGPYEELSDADKARVDANCLPTEYDIHAADSQTKVSASGSDLVMTQKIADIDTTTGNAKLDENGKVVYKTTTATVTTGDNITATSTTDKDGNVTYTISATDTKYAVTEEAGTGKVVNTYTVKEAGENGATIGTIVDTDTDTKYTITGEAGTGSTVNTYTVKEAGENGATIGTIVDTDTKYTAGTNVTISTDNVISATDTDTKYTITGEAGTGSTVNTYTVKEAGENGATIGTIVDTDTKYTEGTNVQISSDNVISATDTDTKYTITGEAGTGSTVNTYTVKEAGENGATIGTIVDTDTKYDVKGEGNINVTSAVVDGVTTFTISATGIVSSDTIVAAGDNVTVDTDSKTDPKTGVTTTTYTVSATAEGEIKEGETKIVSGDTVYDYVTENFNNTVVAAGDNVTVDSKSETKDGITTTTYTVNATAEGEVKEGDTKIVSGDTVYNYLTENFNNTVVEAGDNVTVDSNSETVDGITTTTYTVNAVADGKVESGNTSIVNGDTVYNYVTENFNNTVVEAGDNVTVGSKSETVDGITTTTYTVNAVADGKVESGNTGIVNGDTVYNITGDTNYTSNNYVTNKTNLTGTISDLDNAISQGWVAQVEGKELKTVRYDKDDSTANVLNFKAGQNIEVTGSGSDVTIATADDVKFENVEVTNEFKAGDTVINEGGITTNNITTENIDATTIETQNINVTESITYNGDHIVTDVTYEGDNNTLYVTKGDEVTEYVLQGGGNTYEGDNTTIQISENNIISVIEGDVAKGDKGVITGDTIYKEVRVQKDGNYIKKNNTTAENLTALDEKVYDNAKNIENINNQLAETHNEITNLDNRMRKGLAGAAALAALQPLDFNPDDKLQFSAGVGNYRSKTAAAVGMFYRPDESVMFSLSGTIGNSENTINAGITFGLDGTRNRITRGRTAMAKELVELRSLATQMAARLDRADAAAGIETAMFPDVPENHWAYEYVRDLQKRGALKGYPDGLFKGDRNMTRYEFAAMLDRIVRGGIALDPRIVDEFEPELGRIYVERISGQDNDRKKVERVRVNNQDKLTRDVYGSKIVPAVPGKVAAN